MKYLTRIFMPLFFVGGYALAVVAYSLTANSNAHGNDGGQQLALATASAGSEAGNEAAGGGAADEWKPDNPDQVTSAVNTVSPPVYLFESDITRAYFASNGGKYDQFLDQWHDYFDARGVKYDDLEEEELTPSLKPGILILPSTVALSAEERAAIVAFEKKGGSVLATWETGGRGDGDSMNYGFLHDQFGINVTGEIAAPAKEEFLVVSSQTPVAYTLPPGARMWLGLDEIREHPLRISGGENIAGRFMDWDRTTAMASANEAIVYTEVGPSRRVYFGFPESVWQYDQASVYVLVDDVLNWLRRRPDAYFGNWPYPYRAAQIVEMDTEQGFPNATNFADLLEANGFQGTFYSLTSVAAKYPDVVKRLEHKHEIAYHGDVHDAFKGQSKETQSKRLDAMQKELRPLVSDASKLRGFRPPYELADKVVESLLYEKGFGHILADQNHAVGMLPYLSPQSPKNFQKGLIVLPRTQRDDMNFNADALSSADMTKAMNGEFDQAREFGALGVLSVHSQNFDVGNPVAKSVGEFLAHVKSAGKQTWVAPSGTIESWWRNRAQLKAHLTGDSTKMQLNIVVDKPGLQWSSSLVISNPAKGAKPKVSVAKAGMAEPLVVPLDDYQTAIVFSALEPGNYSYNLSY